VSKVFVVLLAAGMSNRFGRDKLTLNLGGRPLWLVAFHQFLHHPLVGGVGVVCAGDKLEAVRSLAPEALFIQPGGKSRTESSKFGLEKVPADFDLVLIHDAARPFVSEDLITRVIQATEIHGAAFPAIPVTDTIRQRDQGTLTTLDREKLLAVQTPQGAFLHHWMAAYKDFDGDAPDDIAVLEAVGIQSQVVIGEKDNRKITHPADWSHPSEIRTGLGYDIHAFSQDPDRPLWLGGIEFPDDKPGLEGHSDADALFHAITDALLGAAGLGDIGLHYSNTDPRWKNAPSSLFLKETTLLLQREGWHIIHIDASVLAERPRIMRRKDEIRSRIAELCGISVERTSIKATTNEGLGAIGRGEGISAFAVATLGR
jgi:2-C-methyl-D-erythritol 4-phosphate cytidylyltransferase/2-C-methyl-D-erythritol 2,4-cyclodiphosphate synthase